ncbi:hypothetical protein CFIMG_003098RA [Ceratocystis fimbriata CBS 114723]|uniref:F-box domain-containing protein n=1 Tax=Ceratocystis fimbriata CBS 114723 TaxID=1035309 RepID=A0A2C5X2L5_9PEZI|nr:hypothetical protein CFIMG_003098RA [Ceratocystis fimbriata CBS 114723]
MKAKSASNQKRPRSGSTAGRGSHKDISIKPQNITPEWEQKNLGHLSRGAVFELARNYARGNDIEPARCAFTKAATLCPCSRGLIRPPCKCKDFRRAAAKTPPDIFNEAMHNCKCIVSKRFQKCDDAIHISSLNYLAALSLVGNDFCRAASEASWLLEISPRKLEGYLRLAQVAIKQKDFRFAWQIYTAAMNMAQANNLQDDHNYANLVKMREPLNVKFSKLDPITILPYELLLNIVEQLSVGDWQNLLQASKEWHRWMTTCRRLWSSVAFKGHEVASKLAITKLMKYSGNVLKRLYIRRPIMIDAAYLDLLRESSTSLKDLCIDVKEFKKDWLTPGLESAFSFDHLILSARYLHDLTDFEALMAIATNAKAFSVSLYGYNETPQRPLTFPLFHELQDLTLNFSLKHRMCLNMLARNAPQLRRLWLNKIRLYCEPVTAESVQVNPREYFPHLECLIIDEVDMENINPFDFFKYSFPRLKIFRFRNVSCRSQMMSTIANSLSHFCTLSPVPDHSFMQTRDIGVLSIDLLERPQDPAARCLEAALDSGIVECASVEMGLWRGRNLGMSAYKKTALWGSKGVRVLVLTFPPEQYVHSRVTLESWDEGLIPFLESFPNLKSVVIHESSPFARQSRNKAAIVEAIIGLCSTVQTVYDVETTGSERTFLYELAARNGRRIISYQDFDSLEHPPNVFSEPKRQLPSGSRDPTLSFPISTMPDQPCVFW